MWAVVFRFAAWNDGGRMASNGRWKTMVHSRRWEKRLFESFASRSLLQSQSYNEKMLRSLSCAYPIQPCLPLPGLPRLTQQWMETGHYNWFASIIRMVYSLNWSHCAAFSFSTFSFALFLPNAKLWCEHGRPWPLGKVVSTKWNGGNRIIIIHAIHYFVLWFVIWMRHDALCAHRKRITVHEFDGEQARRDTSHGFFTKSNAPRSLNPNTLPNKYFVTVTKKNVCEWIKNWYKISHVHKHSADFLFLLSSISSI